MTAADQALARIEAILSEIEALDRVLRPKLGADACEPDREAFDTVCRIERKRLSNRTQVAAE